MDVSNRASGIKEIFKKKEKKKQIYDTHQFLKTIVFKEPLNTTKK